MSPMKIRNRTLLAVSSIALAVSTLISAPAFAWGAQGHRLVARVAETRLEPAAKAEVERLLALEPGETLASVAPWADQVRANDPDLGRRSARWHYINMGEDGCVYDHARHCRDGNCVIEALKAQSARLGDRNIADAERLQALKFVVHLAGDIHQPLHAGYGHDKGGNTYQLQFNGRGTNLHSLWDSGMFHTLRLSDDDYLKKLRPFFFQRLFSRFRMHSQKIDLQHDATAWAKESCEIAIASGTYPDGGTIDTRYIKKYRPIAEKRVRQAGERLAQLLNTTLGSSSQQ